MLYNAQRAKQLLREGTNNPCAEFRYGQEQAIEQIVDKRNRLLLVQKTGWGKSSVYFIAAKLLREAGTGPALLISPLLALMRNQIVQAERMGISARTIHSDNKEEWEQIEEAVLNNEVDILLISPERLANEHFRTQVFGKISGRISLLIIDEAHCISDWGHDFRPHYRMIERIIRNLPANLRLLATTATANNRVIIDLENVLGPNLVVSRGDLNRPSLHLQTIQMHDQAERMAWLAGILPGIKGSGIIYTLTVRDAAQVARWLQSRGINVESYSSDTGERREEIEKALLENKVKALVATTTLGMGFDKPDLSFVIHYQTPASVIAYYQQVGRAGRAIDSAYGVILSGEEEMDITNFFIDNAFPTRQEVNLVLGALENVKNGLSIPELLNIINVRYGRIEKTTEMLSLESPAPIVKQGSKWLLTTSNLSEEFWERAERLTSLRREEQNQMQEYVKLKSGHMEFLIKALDGNSSNVNSSEVPELSTEINAELVVEAATFLRRTSISFEPRKRWPTGGLRHLNVSGVIQPEYVFQEGKALCIWGDAGWGKLVSKGKYIDNHYDDSLVTACVTLLYSWKPDPPPVWVTCIPSLRHSDLVPEFTKRLANSLGLPFYLVLVKTDDRPQQKTMENSSQQARNVDGSLNVIVSPLPSGPVLLVDDMVDSRWTFTIAAYLLKLHGSDIVFPLALAYTGHGE